MRKEERKKGKRERGQKGKHENEKNKRARYRQGDRPPPTVISKSRDMARLCCCVARSLTTESCSRPSRDGRLAHQRLKSRTSICRLRAWPVAAVQPRVRLSSVADRRASAPARPGSARFGGGSDRPDHLSTSTSHHHAAAACRRLGIFLLGRGRCRPRLILTGRDAGPSSAMYASLL